MFGQNKKQDIVQATVSTKNGVTHDLSEVNKVSSVVRTMEDDLNGSLAAPVGNFESEITTIQDVPVPTPPTPTPYNNQTSSSAQVQVLREDAANEQSPFLTNTPQVSGSNVSSPLKASMAVKPKKSRNSIIDLLVVLAIVALIIAAVVYYFVQSRSGGVLPEVTPVETDATDDQIILDQTGTDKMFPNLDNNSAQTIDISKYPDIMSFTQQLHQLAAMQKTMGEKMTINIVDENGPVFFNSFAQRYLPLLPNNLVTVMDAPFELYIYSEGTQQQIGIAALTRDSAAVNTALRQNETILPEAFSPLFLAQKSEIISAPVFEDSSYMGIPTRYYNFASGAIRSFNYAVHYERVFFSTDSTTLQKLIMTVLESDQELLRQKGLDGLIDEYTLSNATGSEQWTDITTNDADMPRIPSGPVF